MLKGKGQSYPDTLAIFFWILSPSTRELEFGLAYNYLAIFFWILYEEDILRILLNRYFTTLAIFFWILYEVEGRS